MTEDRYVKKFILSLGVLLLTLISLPNSVFGQNRERQQIMADVRMLHEQTMRLQQLISTLELTIIELGSQLDEQANATTRAFADQRLLTDNLGADSRILREKLDDTNIRISSMSQEVEALRISIPSLAMRTAVSLAEDSTSSSLLDGPAELSDENLTPITPGLSPQRLYDTAWADYTNGQWDLAIEGFEAYLITFPRSELADDAQFYIGQTRYADGQFQQSVLAFEKVLLDYPDGDVVPEAAYKRGLALDRLGKSEKAIEAFEFITKDYPDNTMAILARQALDRLRQP